MQYIADIRRLFCEQLFDCPKFGFEPLKRGKPRSPHVHSVHLFNFKETVMQTEKALINDDLRVSIVS